MNQLGLFDVSGVNKWKGKSEIEESVKKYVTFNGEYRVEAFTILRERQSKNGNCNSYREVTIDLRQVIEKFRIEKHPRIVALNGQYGIRALKDIPKNTCFGQYFGGEILQEAFGKVFDGTGEEHDHNIYAFDQRIDPLELKKLKEKQKKMDIERQNRLKQRQEREKLEKERIRAEQQKKHQEAMNKMNTVITNHNVIQPPSHHGVAIASIPQITSNGTLITVPVVVNGKSATNAAVNTTTTTNNINLNQSQNGNQASQTNANNQSSNSNKTSNPNSNSNTNNNNNPTQNESKSNEEQKEDDGKGKKGSKKKKKVGRPRKKSKDRKNQGGIDEYDDPEYEDIPNKTFIIDPFIGDWKNDELLLRYVNDCRADIDDTKPTKDDHKYYNVEFVGMKVNGWPQTYLIAKRDIKKGEELMTYYGTEFSNAITMKMEEETRKKRRKARIDEDILQGVKL